MRLFFATSNAAKVASVSRVLGKYGIRVERVNIDLPELQGESASEIAIGKVRAAFERVRSPVMVIDSALHIPVLGGFPGTNVKWTTKQILVTGYLDLLARYANDADRRCVFEDVIAYMDGAHGEPHLFIRREEGRLATEPRGALGAAHKSLMALLFIPHGEEKTLAEMTDDEFAAYRARPEMERHYRDLAGFLTGSPQTFE